MPTTDETATSAGEVVHLRREELGLSKAELARRARLTRSSIHEIELGQRAHLQARTIRRLEEALGMPPGSLEPRGPKPVLVKPLAYDVPTATSVRLELEETLSDRRYESLLVMLRRVADRVDELELELKSERRKHA